MREFFDVALIGGGPAAVFAAYEFSLKYPELKVVILEEGHPIEQRKCPLAQKKVDHCLRCVPCDIMRGFGGAGAFSDGKYNFTTEFGGWLNEYLPHNEVIDLIDYVDELNCRHGAPGEYFSTKNCTIGAKALGYDLHLLNAKVRHLGTENNLIIMENIYKHLLEKGIDPITFPGLRVTVPSDESRMINADRVPKVILSASGMCEAGRIRHHLKHNLWRPECTILFVGYQAVGTLGRTLIDGAVNVKLFGETIDVQAEICQLTGLSGHADREGLLAWVNAFSPKPKRVFVIHGEDEVENIFAQTLTEQGFTACAPYNGEQWAIGAEGAVCLQEGSRVRLEHKPSEGASRAATVFQRLVSAGKRLLRVIEHNEGGANKDLAKFADQVNALCDKWDR